MRADQRWRGVDTRADSRKAPLCRWPFGRCRRTHPPQRLRLHLAPDHLRRFLVRTKTVNADVPRAESPVDAPLLMDGDGVRLGAVDADHSSAPARYWAIASSSPPSFVSFTRGGTWN